MRVVVVGAGVVGLLAAHALAHGGHRVVVVTRDDPVDTTSATAGASFKPRLVADSPVLRPLLVASRDVLAAWAGSGFAAVLGIRRHRHVVATRGPRLELPHLDLMDDVAWSRADRGGALVADAQLAVSFTTWFFDVEKVLPTLVGHLATDHDVRVEVAEMATLAEAAEQGQVVVNASGLAARVLADDAAIVPVRGQVVRVRSTALAGWDPGRSISLDGRYVYPRPDGVLVGGTADWGDEDTSPDPRVTRRLVADAAVLAPGLAAATDDELEAAVGLRPFRHGGVRVERGRDLGDTPVVHAYGHGGAGWTLAPGTAERVADLVRALR